MRENISSCSFFNLRNFLFRSSCPDMFLGKGVLEILSKFTKEHPCRSVISVIWHTIYMIIYWNSTLVWVFSCKHAAYFQNTFLLRTTLDGWFCLLHSTPQMIIGIYENNPLFAENSHYCQKTHHQQKLKVFHWHFLTKVKHHKKYL